jgi:hypothetical protein
VSTIGELNDIGVEDLVDVLSRRERTGRLTIKSGGQEVHLYFEAGKLALVTSTDITLRLGRMLIRQGLLDSTRLLEALHDQAESRNQRSLGAILLERDWVTGYDLERCVEEQAIDALAKAVADEPGLFVFEPGIRRPAHVDAVPLDPETLLTAARDRHAALLVLRRNLPPDHTWLTLDLTVLRSQPTDELGVQEAMVTGALKSGPKSHAELRFHLALDELSLGVTLLSLLERGIVVTATNGAGGNVRTSQLAYARPD